MKASFLTGFRALVFALAAFALLVAGGIEIRSSLDVAGFVLGLAAFWVLIEKTFLSRTHKKPRG
tara:strand:- start:346 stop:537 length:192 start_codon:yes stop_codon:yes gene_type:complete